MDICGYIDYQYSILNRSLLEAEIEYQHECFETLKKKYDRYITEADEEESKDAKSNNNSKAPSLSANLWYRLKKSVNEFIKKITDAMQRWIVKILSHCKKFSKEVEDYFITHEKEIKAPKIHVYAIASACVNVMRNWNESNDTDERNKIIRDYLDQDNIPKEETKYRDELKELLSYKDAIKTVKDTEKMYINQSKVFNDKDAVAYTKEWLHFCKNMIKLIQARATYAAKLILKAAKMSKSGANISEDDIKKMDQDIKSIDSDIKVEKIVHYS